MTPGINQRNSKGKIEIHKYNQSKQKIFNDDDLERIHFMTLRLGEIMDDSKLQEMIDRDAYVPFEDFNNILSKKTFTQFKQQIQKPLIFSTLLF